ncbi:MAG TPA: thiamine phosphate synthase [Candidatus Tyrphobacter sp.]
MTRALRASLLHGIYAIVDEEPRALEIARAALAAGVRIVQYRAKDGVVDARLRALRELTRAYHALLILDDDWRAAIAYECDGVHLGPGDEGFADPASVRAGLPELVIGLSCGSEEEARAAEPGADYLGIGAVYATNSKRDAGAPIGIDGLRRIASSTRLPVAAIGGISLENLREIRESGVAMAATISAIARDPNPGDAARRLVALWNDGSPT